MGQGPHPGKVNGPQGTRASGPSRGSDERLLGSYCAGCGGGCGCGCGCGGGGCMVLALVVRVVARVMMQAGCIMVVVSAAVVMVPMGLT